jgi:uncharacterized protein (TIGR00297 family)
VAPALFARWQIQIACLLLLVLLPFGAGRGAFSGVVNAQRTIGGPVAFVIAYFIIVSLAHGWTDAALPFLVLGIADAAASLCGKRWGRTPLGPATAKTAAGTFAFTLSAFVVTLPFAAVALGLPWFPALLLSLFVSSIAAAVEAVSASWLDNLTVPLSVFLVQMLAREWRMDDMRVAAVLFGMTVILVSVSLRQRWLNGAGACALAGIAFLLAATINAAFIAVILFFFVSSSALTRVSSRKVSLQKDHSGRSARQVIALGLLPALGVAAARLTGNTVYLDMALAAVAAATADTWATEIGRHAKRNPILITTLRRVPAGTSGGVSLLGLAASLAGALAIGFGAQSLGATHSGLAIALAGAAAALADSILGATLQAKYRCPLCNRTGETRERCHEVPLQRVAGLPLLDNEAVNTAMTVLAALGVGAIGFL